MSEYDPEMDPPEPEPFDPGPEADDVGGMSEHRPEWDEVARAEAERDAWGGKAPEPGYGYADWAAEGREPEAGS